MMVDQREVNLAQARKSVRRWGKCQLVTGYIMAIFNGVSAITNFFMLFAISNWTEIPFWDYNGTRHVVKLEEGGIFFLCLMKIIANIMLFLWGRDAIRTFKPIVKEVENEQFQGLSPNHVQEADTKAAKIKTHSRKVFKFIFASFVVTAITLMYLKSYFIKTADVFIDDEYDRYQAQNTVSTQSSVQPLVGQLNFSEGSTIAYAQAAPATFDFAASSQPIFANVLNATSAIFSVA